jgi:RNA polymerase sigma-70 factor
MCLAASAAPNRNGPPSPVPRSSRRREAQRERDAALRLGPRESRWIEGREAAFGEFVAARLSIGVAGTDSDVDARVADLALLFGSIHWNDGALREFTDCILARLGPALDDVDLRQDLLGRLFLSIDGAAPRADGYRGHGSLVGWVRTIARNLMSSRHRRRLPLVDVAEETVAGIASGPEEAYVGRQTSTVFAAALCHAVSALSRRDRHLLHLHYIERRSVQEIARVFAIHRETAGLWLGAARERFANETRTRLQTTLGVSRREADSIVESAIAGGVVSVGGLLAAAASEPAIDRGKHRRSISRSLAGGDGRREALGT